MSESRVNTYNEEKQAASLPFMRAQPHVTTTSGVTVPTSLLSQMRGPAWEGAAMFIGTLAWMGVYYAGPTFAEIDDDGPGSFILHCLAMGIGANIAALPFVRQKYISQGYSSEKANAEVRKYFILCTIPDALYEPVADWLAAMAKGNSVIDFEFEKYTDPTFNTAEVAGAFGVFGVTFGLIYYLGDLLIQHYSPDVEEMVLEEKLTDDATVMHRFLRKARDMSASTKGVAVLAALQYFIFYLTDYVFDVDWESFEETAPPVLGMCGLMSLYTILAVAAPLLLQALEHKIYGHAAPDRDQIVVIVDNDLKEKLIKTEEKKKHVAPHAANDVSPPAQNSHSFWNRSGSSATQNKPDDKKGDYQPLRLHGT
jgi:hypothetical protein